MIRLEKVGNAINFTFDDNDHYLYNGTISVPVNSLTLVTDVSEMFTFKKSATNDIFISGLYSEIGMTKSELEAFYRTNMVGSTGGGGSITIDPTLDGSSTNPVANSAITNAILSNEVNISAVSAIVTTEVSARTSGDEALDAKIGAVSGAVDSIAEDAIVDADYVSSATTIEFYNASGSVVASIDATDFIKDGMIDSVAISGGNLVIIFNTDSGKEDIEIPLTDIFNPSNYYDKTAIDGIVSGLNDSIDEKLDASAYTPTDLSNYDTKDEVNAKIAGATSGKVDTSDFNSYSGAVDTAINSKASQTSVDTLNGVVTAHTANTNIHVTTAQTAAWDAKSNFSGSYNDLTDKPTIPTVPTSNTAFTNDAGYITNDALSGYAESSAVTEEITAAVSGKQDTLSAGTNITISGNVISAEGGGKAIEAGRGISITTGETADTISFSLPISAGTGTNSIEEGSSNVASGAYSHAEGQGTSATTTCSHTEGQQTLASGAYSHAEGQGTKAKGNWSHAEGYNSEANGTLSHVNGYEVNAYNHSETSIGRHNKSVSASTTFGDSGNTLFSVGNGTGENARHNAFEIRQNGDIYITSGGTDIKLQDNLGGGGSSITVDPTLDSGSTNPVANSAITTEILNNEAITSAALNDLNNRKAELSAMTFELNLKQDVLSAGTGIDITNNVISSIATGEQSDWNETDQNSEAYIKNRPFYGTGGWVYIIYSNENSSVNIVSDMSEPTDLGFVLSVGKQYQISYMYEYQEVTPQNIEYTPKDRVLVGTPQVNNTGEYTDYAYIMGYNSEEPWNTFAVSNDLENWYFVNYSNSNYGVYVIVYDLVNDPLVQLDSKYIKNDIARVSAVTASLATKQDVLSAGTGIEISGNVISATGGVGGDGVQPSSSENKANKLKKINNIELSNSATTTGTTNIEVKRVNGFEMFGSGGNVGIRKINGSIITDLISGNGQSTINLDVHGDWNVNDSGSTNYIKNRPFYEETSTAGTYETVCVVDDEYWQMNVGCIEQNETFNFTTNTQLHDGDYISMFVGDSPTYYPTWFVQGVQITENMGTYYGSKDNYSFTSYDGLNWECMWGGSTNCSAPKIAKVTYPTITHKLDSKFIDSDIARASRLGGLSLVKLTQSAYDALVQAGTTDPNTLYVIVD